MSASAWGSEGGDSVLSEGGLFDCGGKSFTDGVEGGMSFTGGKEGDMSFSRASATEREAHDCASTTERKPQSNNPPLQLQASGTHEYIETSLISSLASE